MRSYGLIKAIYAEGQAWESASDENSFIKQVRNTRNYLTHYDKSLQGKAIKGEDLYWLTQTLEFLLQACFLKGLGFSTEQCVALFKRNKQYQFAVKLAKPNSNEQ